MVETICPNSCLGKSNHRCPKIFFFFFSFPRSISLVETTPAVLLKFWHKYNTFSPLRFVWKMQNLSHRSLGMSCSVWILPGNHIFWWKKIPGKKFLLQNSIQFKITFIRFDASQFKDVLCIKLFLEIFDCSTNIGNDTSMKCWLCNNYSIY